MHGHRTKNTEKSSCCASIACDGSWEGTLFAYVITLDIIM